MRRFGVLVLGTALGMAALSPAAAGIAVAAQEEKAPPRAQGYCAITPREAKALIETRRNLVVIDVRSPKEYAQGALPGSVLIPFREAMAGYVAVPKDTPLLIVCAVGGRSLAVGRYLALKGYQEVYNLKGGLEAWIEQRVPLPVKKN